MKTKNTNHIQYIIYPSEKAKTGKRENKYPIENLEKRKMGTLRLNSHCGLSSNFSAYQSFKLNTCSKTTFTSKNLSFIKRGKIRAVGTVPDKDQAINTEATQPEEPPSIGFAFVSVSCSFLF